MWRHVLQCLLVGVSAGAHSSNPHICILLPASIGFPPHLVSFPLHLTWVSWDHLSKKQSALTILSSGVCFQEAKTKTGGVEQRHVQYHRKSQKPRGFPVVLTLQQSAGTIALDPW